MKEIIILQIITTTHLAAAVCVSGIRGNIDIS